MAQLALITIDLDDTLWPCRPPLELAEQAVFDWLGRHAPRLAAAHSIQSLREHRVALRAERADIAHDMTALRLQSLRMLMAQFGYGAQLAEQVMTLFLEYRNRVSPYPDAVPVLKELAAAYRLASLTNGNSDVECTPLRGCFHRAFRAEDVGAAKPDPALFAAALEWAGTRPQQALHVGDDPLRDVDAARRFGMRAVWVNRNGMQWPRDLEPPELEISDLHGLRPWISQQFG